MKLNVNLEGESMTTKNVLSKKDQALLDYLLVTGMDADKVATEFGIVVPYAKHRIKLLVEGKHIADNYVVPSASEEVTEVEVEEIDGIEKEAVELQPSNIEKTQSPEQSIPVTCGNVPDVSIIPCNMDVSELVPERDTTYLVRKGIDDVIAKYGERSSPLFAVGETGSGKTMAFRQYAAEQELPFLRVACDDSAILKEFVGRREIISGTTYFKIGLLLKMVQQPSVILFDEFNALPASKLFFLHELLDTKKLFVKDAGNGMIINVHPECKIFLACNPCNGKYTGTNRVNIALADRGGYLHVPDFKVSEVQELFKCDDANITSSLMQFYKEIHELIQKQNLRVAFSLRSVKRIVEAIAHGDSIEEALSVGFYNSALLTATDKEKEALREVARVCFGIDKFKRN